MRWFSRKTPSSPSEPPATVRDGFFSTNTPLESPNNRISLWKRQQEAMARTFQRGIDALKPIDANGNETASDLDFAMDEAYPDLTQAKLMNSRAGYLPIAQLEWFANQGFIGWQMCAVLSQNWLIDKICGVPAQDAVRKGYDVTLNNGEKIDPEILQAIR